ncbi:MAG TPA: di-heme oxidoredictase family protein [Steroidobacteraceae bacterium]|nr:di-heme oxidoredictase family protein [Steroidobacteraceae bacterium]
MQAGDSLCRASAALAFCALAQSAHAQLTDQTQTPNAEGAGISKSLEQQIGAGVGNAMTPNSSTYIIARDPARSIRRGRQLFQRKFTLAQGFGPRTLDGIGDIEAQGAIGAGLIESCAGCHGRPRGAAGFGGDVVTRPDSRDAPHLFGLGLQEMLADEITTDLRAIRDRAISDARRFRQTVTYSLRSKNIQYGSIRAFADGRVDTSGVRGVDPDLRVRPFFAQGGTTSIREFVIGAFNDEMGLQAVDPLLTAAAAGARRVTPTGMVLDGSKDLVQKPLASSPNDDLDNDGVRNEIPTSLVDHMEFYLFNYFKPGTYRQTSVTAAGRTLMSQIGCTGCHIPDLVINRDRRVADVNTVYDPEFALFNGLYATASLLLTEQDDGTGHPTLKRPQGRSFVVRNFFADMKRHDLGPNFHERNYNGSIERMFMTEPLWGVGSTPPYGHDGRSINLREVILRHGGEAAASRNAFARLSESNKSAILEFLNSLVLFPPDDTASNLDPGDPNAPGFPQRGHGSIKLTVLFNDPNDPE